MYKDQYDFQMTIKYIKFKEGGGTEVQPVAAKERRWNSFPPRRERQVILSLRKTHSPKLKWPRRSWIRLVRRATLPRKTTLQRERRGISKTWRKKNWPRPIETPFYVCKNQVAASNNFPTFFRKTKMFLKVEKDSSPAELQECRVIGILPKDCWNVVDLSNYLKD